VVVVLEVEVLVLEVVVVLVVEQVLPVAVKSPCRPIALSSTEAFPLFLTWTLTVVASPETERVVRVAARLP
jgi:hypothetical protein